VWHYFIVVLIVVMLNVVMLNVVMLKDAALKNRQVGQMVKHQKQKFKN
jgi:hypothetical protein